MPALTIATAALVFAMAAASVADGASTPGKEWGTTNARHNYTFEVRQSDLWLEVELH